MDEHDKWLQAARSAIAAQLTRHNKDSTWVYANDAYTEMLLQVVSHCADDGEFVGDMLAKLREWGFETSHIWATINTLKHACVIDFAYDIFDPEYVDRYDMMLVCNFENRSEKLNGWAETLRLNSKEVTQDER